MKLYRIKAPKYYEDYILTESERSYELEKKYDGDDLLLKEWGCKEIKVCNKGKKGDLGYCNSFSYALILKGRALEEIQDVFEDEAELLPVKCGDDIWYIVHSTKIEEEISFAVRGRVIPYRIFNNGSKEAELCNKYFFRAYNRYGTPTEMIYTEKFIELINKLKLKGVDFTESGEIMEQ